MTKVLYVEHNDDNRYMLKTRLELLDDFQVLTAEDSSDRYPWHRLSPLTVQPRRGFYIGSQSRLIELSNDDVGRSSVITIKKIRNPRKRDHRVIYVEE